MLTPEQLQEQLLPYLYDLLGPEERHEVEATLAASAEARANLAEAKAKRELLALAVKDHFPEMIFAPPKGKRLAETSRRLPPRPKPRRSWLPWAVAATIVLALLGGGGYYSVAGWVAQKQKLAEVTAKFDKASIAALDLEKKLNEDKGRAQVEVQALQTEINELVNDWNKELAVQKKIVNQNQVQVIIQSPRTLQAGATNSIQVELKRNQNAPQPPGKTLPQLRASVVDQASKAVLFARLLETREGQTKFNVDLPRDLPVKPGMDLAFEVATTGANGAPVEVREHLTLAAPEYVTHLYTDRPMYRPGETVHFRSLTLERFSLKPAQEELRLRFRITGPSQAEIFKTEGTAQVVAPADVPPLKGPDGQALRGIGAGDFRIPDGLAGGQYTLHVSEANDRFPAEKRTFIIHQWQAPRINKEITFDRSSYGPGDSVEITARGVSVEGAPPGQKMFVNLSAKVDGRVLRVTNGQTVDADGRIRWQFFLPQSGFMPKGNGIVSVTFHDGGNQETIVRPIPIVLGKLFIDFYPEGGELVAGLPNRVYFQARTITGKPADLIGHIVDQAGTVVAKLQTLTDDKEPGINQGMGAFVFTPQSNKIYELKIDSPAGMHGKDNARRDLLPAAKNSGVVLRLPQGVVGDTIDVEVTSAGKDRELLVGAYCRGKLLDHVNVTARAGQLATATLRPTLGVGGVYRITVFEKDAGKIVPVAERLVFRPAAARLDLTVTADKAAYYPGDRVQLSLKAANEKKELSPAVLLVAVVDLSVHKLANDKTARAMPTHFLLTSEVRQPEDLEEADVFLGTHPKAHQALDLLLGVQGWRRFAEQDPARFKVQNRDAGRIVQAAGPGGMQTNNPEKDVVAKVDAQFAPKFVELQKKLADREKIEEGNPEIQRQIQLQQGIIQFSQTEIGNAVTRLEEYERFLTRLSIGALVISTLLVGLLMLYLGMKRLARGRSGVVYFAIGATVLLFLFMGSLAGTFLLMGGRGFDNDAPWMNRAAPMALAKAAPMPVPPPPMAPAPQAAEALPQDLDGLQPPRMVLQEDRMEAAKAAAVPLAPPPPAPPPAPDALALARANAPAAPMVGAGAPPVAGPGMPGVGGPAGPMVAGGLMAKAEPWFDENRMARRQNERRLRQQGKFHLILSERLQRVVKLPANPDPFVMREYAHRHELNPGAVRADFTETLYWHPALTLAKGTADIAFDVSDASTRFQVVAFGHTQDGRLGATTFEITSRLPVSIEPKVPIEVTSGDTVTIPIAVANDRNETAAAILTIESKNLSLLPDPVQNAAEAMHLSIDGNKRVQTLVSFQPAVKEGKATLRVAGDFGVLGKDAVERSFTIVPEGFPVIGSQSGLLEKSASHEFTLPPSWVPGTLKCQVQVYPSTLAELQKGLESLLREPHGCFEQSSTSNYPNVLILNYLKEAELSKPEVETRARQLLTRGYAKLTSFECLDPVDVARREGYEWFGQTAPPHEALTAYGLLQFKDMAKVYPVDEGMLQRTQQYLLNQRDSKGGFKRNPRALDSFGRAPDHVTNAYIVWALTESGLTEDLGPELKALYAKAKDAADPYFLALAGIGHINQNKSKEGIELLKNLIKYQQDDGHLQGARTSITGSGGRDLLIETTALATLGWLKANRPEEFNVPVDKAVKWLGQQRGGYGGFGATQSTILALKALIAHTREHKKPIEAGDLQLYVNLREAPVIVKSFTPSVQEPITLTVPDADSLVPGLNRVRVQITGRNEFPYTLSWSYHTVKPANPENCPVHLSASLQKSDIKEGDTVRLTATVENKSGQGQGMAVAIIGLPGGLSLPEDFAQLKELTALRERGTKPGIVSAWELRGRELVLYWRDLAPDAKIEVGLDLVARLPGSYRGPAPRAYLYYNADNKFWSEPLAITIRPTGGSN